MAYRALYREYRPRIFEDVVGQEHITTALKNQISSGHISHAYLFCGTRGTGKTSTAKILARAVNCLHPDNGEPCMQCEACKASIDPSCTDIIELDAASNNSVDDARAIIEQAQYAPLALRYRVFIIDEVHMLSGNAFNALLKTLEEPPAHVCFILATTEPQKLPATIISRCQRYDFRRLSTADILSTLKKTLKKAGASIDEQGLMLIAKAADGGMRDALSLADQCISFMGNTVSKADVYDILGSMDREFLGELADSLLNENAPHALSMVNRAVIQGKDLSVLTNDLIAHFRALLFAKTCGRCEELLDCSPDDMDMYLRQAETSGRDRLQIALDILIDTAGKIRYLPSPRTAIESALLRISRPENEVTPEGLNFRLKKLEQGGIPAPTVPARSIAPQNPVPPPVPAVSTRTVAVPVNEVIPVENTQLAPAIAPSAAAQNNAGFANRSETVLSAPADNEAAELWGLYISELTKANAFAAMTAKYAFPVSYVDHVLTIGFPSSAEAKKKSLQLAVDKYSDIPNTIRPGMQLRLIISDSRQVSVPEEDIAQLREAFGDKLIIQD